eukprot:764830-Hanusia_phi.AAC.3
MNEKIHQRRLAGRGRSEQGERPTAKTAGVPLFTPLSVQIVRIHRAEVACRLPLPSVSSLLASRYCRYRAVGAPRL